MQLASRLNDALEVNRRPKTKNSNNYDMLKRRIKLNESATLTFKVPPCSWVPEQKSSQFTKLDLGVDPFKFVELFEGSYDSRKNSEKDESEEFYLTL